MRRGRAAATVAGLLLAGLLPVAPASAATGFCAQAGLDTFRWDGEAGNGLWADPVNWDHRGNANDVAPGSAPAGPYDDLACIRAGAVVQLDTGRQGVSADLAVLDLDRSATLTVGLGGALVLHGSAGSVARPGSRLDLVGSTLGGEATLTVQGTMHWTSVDAGAATQTTRRCDVSAPPTCSGRAPRPGRTLVAAGGTLFVDGRGVNLEDSRVLQNDGTTVLSGAGYVAADHGTSIVNRGTFSIRNGLGVFEGRSHYGLPLGTFRNGGLLSKSAAGTSVVSSTYTTTTGGSISVTAGALSLNAGRNGTSTATTARVQQGASFGTGACDPGAATCSAARPVATDRQTASVALPALGTGLVAVTLQELPGEKTAATRAAPVRVETPGVQADAAHPMVYAFALDSSLRRPGETPAGLAASLPVARKGDTDPAYTVVPACTAAGLSARVPSCVDRAESGRRTTALGNGDVVLVVRSLQNSRWVV